MGCKVAQIGDPFSVLIMLGLCIVRKLKIFMSDQMLLNQSGEGMEHKGPDYSFFAFSTFMKW